MGALFARFSESERSPTLAPDHPSDKDPSPGTPVDHPSDKDPSLGTPADHPSDKDPSLGTPVRRKGGARIGSVYGPDQWINTSLNVAE
jgi:hypothetical protein